MRKRTLIIVLAIVLVAAFAGGGLLVLRIFFMRIVHVPTGAMMNTIIPGDHLVVTKTFGRIERGQVVVFQYPADRTSYVARVVGLPGETIFMRGNTVFINDRPLDELRVFVKPDNFGREPLEEISTEGTGPYRVFYSKRADEEDEFLSMAEFATNAPFRIPDDNFFMLGDNRDNSADSRFQGPVPRNLIWGTTQVIYMSVSPHSDEVRSERVLRRIQ